MFKEILSLTICELIIESPCKVGYVIFRGPEFIFDNYVLSGLHLHGLLDVPPGIPPVHQILQDPVSIVTGT